MAAQGRQRRQQARSLLGEIGKDQTISDITRKELADRLNPSMFETLDDLADNRGSFGELGGVMEFDRSGLLGSVRSELGKAREGGGKFAGRQLQSKRRTQLADRPGRSQTVLTR